MIRFPFSILIFSFSHMLYFRILPIFHLAWLLISELVLFNMPFRYIVMYKDSGITILFESSEGNLCWSVTNLLNGMQKEKYRSRRVNAPEWRL